MKKAKYIECAYASSPMAKKLGFENTGCYFVQICKNANSYMPVGTAKVGFATKEEATTAANNMPEVWHSKHIPA